jgi:hypothetical protein
VKSRHGATATHNLTLMKVLGLTQRMLFSPEDKNTQNVSLFFFLKKNRKVVRE